MTFPSSDSLVDSELLLTMRSLYRERHPHSFPYSHLHVVLYSNLTQWLNNSRSLAYNRCVHIHSFATIVLSLSRDFLLLLLLSQYLITISSDYCITCASANSICFSTSSLFNVSRSSLSIARRSFSSWYYISPIVHQLMNLLFAWASIELLVISSVALLITPLVSSSDTDCGFLILIEFASQ